jgi:hypothetical protein
LVEAKQNPPSAGRDICLVKIGFSGQSGKVNTQRLLKITCLLSLLVLPAMVQAQFTYTTNADGSLNITGDTNIPINGVVMIPSTITDLPVTSIGDWAFYATSLTNVLIPDSVTSIGDGAFFDCESLTNVTIGDSVTSIGDWTFAFCSSLTGINFRGNPPTLGGNNVFYGNLATVYYLSGATGWGPTFDGHPAVLWNPPVPFTYTIDSDGITLTITGYTGSGGTVTIPSTINFLPVTSIGYIVFAYYSGLTSVVIPYGVTSIGEESFTFCENLTNVTIPASVTNIGDQAFASCTALKEINVDPLNFFYQSENGVLFNYNKTTLIQFPGGGPQNYNIPASVSVIGDFAFSYSDVTSVMITSNVNEILTDAFVGCGNLTSITIPSSISTISDYAFLGCSSLTNVTLSDGIYNLGTASFAQCGNLTQIVIPRSVTNFSGGPFSNSGLKQVFFEGNAPNYNAFDLYRDGAILYYLPNTTGWDLYALLNGVPTALWLPQEQNSSTSFRGQTNQFGFNINWASGETVVVEACTNLTNPVWQPIQTNTLTSGYAYFSDPQWTNYPGRFYRLRSP